MITPLEHAKYKLNIACSQKLVVPDHQRIFLNEMIVIQNSQFHQD